MRRRTRCSFCGNQGHNRATCPSIKAHIKDDPNGYYARQEDHKKSHRVKSPRLCSYCKKSGHNKATCTELTHDRFQHTKKNKDFGKTFIEACKVHGFGPGALMELMKPEDFSNPDNYKMDRLRNSWKSHGPLAMVIGFEEKYLNADLSSDRGYLGGREQVVKLRFPNGKLARCHLPVEFKNVATESQGCCHGYWKIGCPVETGGLEKAFSSEWKAGAMGVEYQLGLENGY
jgi:hypothetical protein